MPAPATADDLLALLGKSRLLESADLGDRLRHRHDSAEVLATPHALAELLVRDGLLTRFQADNLLQGKWMRFFVGPYKVLEAIAAGSAGVVYLCEHGRLGRRVAIKVLQGDKAKDARSLERFYREARAAASLDHPNIVRAFDVGQEDRLHYLVMEYVDGPNLRQLVKEEGPLSATRAADYLRQTALGLGHAHAAGLVHRDVKPTNLMIDRQGVVKILDLGLARFFEDESGELTQGLVLGNADFIAPEQALDSHAVDGRADVYSLGATFWYALTGSRPARAGLEFLRRPSAGGRKAEEEHPDVPEGLWRVLRKMMAPRPEDRYQTPSEVIEAVSPWAPDEVTRLLLADTPPPEPAAEAPPQAEVETVQELPAAAPAPATAPGPAVAPPVRKSKAVARRRPLRVPAWLVRHRWPAAGVLAVLMLAGGFFALYTPARPPVPGRGPGARPYFKPVTPHSP